MTSMIAYVQKTAKMQWYEFDINWRLKTIFLISRHYPFSHSAFTSLCIFRFTKCLYIKHYLLCFPPYISWLYILKQFVDDPVAVLELGKCHLILSDHMILSIVFLTNSHETIPRGLRRKCQRLRVSPYFRITAQCNSRIKSNKKNTPESILSFPS